MIKRGLTGTYTSAEPFHLFLRPDVQVFRYNRREMNDGNGFNTALRDARGK